MISGIIFPAQLHRARGQLVNIGAGEYVTVTHCSVLSVLMTAAADRIEISYRLTSTDGATVEYHSAHHQYMNLTPQIGYLVTPRAVLLGTGGRLDRLVVEFIKTADFALDPLPGLFFPTKVTKP